MAEQPSTRGTAAFLSRDFRLYQMARASVIIGAEAQALAVAWQVYQITHSALALGYTGLALFLPGVLLILPSGHVADRYDRRAVLLVCYSLQMLCTSALLWFSWHGLRSVWPIYTVLALIGTWRSFSGPASSALVPHLVPKDHFVNAVTWGSTIFQIANIVGPAIGGILFTLPLRGKLSGASAVFLFTLVTLAGYLALILMLSIRPGRMEKRATSIDVVLAGFHYVWQRKILLGSISLDLFAVLLGGSVALLPIFAQDILHAGPRGLGILRAAPALRRAHDLDLAGLPPPRPPRGKEDVPLRRPLWSWHHRLRPLAQHPALRAGADAGGRRRHGQRRDSLLAACNSPRRPRCADA